MAEGNGAAKFDLASIAMTRADDGVPMTILHPLTRQPIMTASGQPMSITLAGRFSETNRQALRAIQVKRVEMVDARQPITEEHITRENIDQLSACTQSWNFDELDGQPFPCTPQNIRRFWSDKRFIWLHERALQFIAEDRNFLSVNSTTSSDGQNTSSGLVSLSPITAAA